MVLRKGWLRSLAELEFMASLEPCPNCGVHGSDTLRPSGTLSGSRRRRIGVTARCPVCATERYVGVDTDRDLTAANVDRFHLGGDMPSSTIAATEFRSEFERLRPLVLWNVEELDPPHWLANGAIVDRAITCLVELAKFRASEPASPDRSDTSTNDRLDSELDLLLELDRRRQRDAPRIWATLEGSSLSSDADSRPVQAEGTLTVATLQRHRDWLVAGRTGDGRLAISHVEMPEAAVGTHNLSHAEFSFVRLTGADLAFSDLSMATFTDSDLSSGQLARCNFSGARIHRTRFDRAGLGLARFDGAVIDDGCFDESFLDRTSWDGAAVTRTSFKNAAFGNAALDGARFEDCDFRGADLSLATPRPMGTSAAAVFIRCDLRDTRWADRDLSGAEFVECAWYGANGRPARIEGVHIIRPHLSPDPELGRDRTVGALDDVLRMLGCL